MDAALECMLIYYGMESCFVLDSAAGEGPADGAVKCPKIKYIRFCMFAPSPRPRPRPSLVSDGPPPPPPPPPRSIRRDPVRSRARAAAVCSRLRLDTADAPKTPQSGDFWGAGSGERGGWRDCWLRKAARASRTEPQGERAHPAGRRLRGWSCVRAGRAEGGRGSEGGGVSPFAMHHAPVPCPGAIHACMPRGRGRGLVFMTRGPELY